MSGNGTICIIVHNMFINTSVLPGLEESIKAQVNFDEPQMPLSMTPVLKSFICRRLSMCLNPPPHEKKGRGQLGHVTYEHRSKGYEFSSQSYYFLIEIQRIMVAMWPPNLYCYLLINSKQFNSKFYEKLRPDLGNTDRLHLQIIIYFHHFDIFIRTSFKSIQHLLCI